MFLYLIGFLIAFIGGAVFLANTPSFFETHLDKEFFIVRQTFSIVVYTFLCFIPIVNFIMGMTLIVYSIVSYLVKN